MSHLLWGPVAKPSLLNCGKSDGSGLLRPDCRLVVSDPVRRRGTEQSPLSLAISFQRAEPGCQPGRGEGRTCRYAPPVLWWWPLMRKQVTHH